VVYRCNPQTPLDLIPIPNLPKFSWEAEKRAKEIQDLNVKVKERIEKSNDQAYIKPTSTRKKLIFNPVV